MDVKIIAAVDEDGGIGKGGRLPWGRMKADMRRFRELTEGHAVVMGRRTFESMGSRPLPGRRNLVLSSQRDVPGVSGALVPGGHGSVVVPSFKDAVDLAAEAGEEKLWAIGGTAVYEAALPYAHHLYLTLVDGRFGCDVFFPKVHLHRWVMVEEYPYRSADDDNAEGFTFVEYVPR